MITITRLAKLFGISDQTIRMYEKYGLLRLPRALNGKYRVFSSEAFTSLIKTRILQCYGFSMKKIASMMNNDSYENTIRSFEERSSEIEQEIRLLTEKREALNRLRADIEQIHQKQGTCEMVTSDGFYLYPVLTQNKIQLCEEDQFLNSWNEYAFIRQDINTLKLEDDDDLNICFGIKEEDVHRHGIDVRYAQYIPSMRCVKAYFICHAEDIYHYREKLAFALDYMRQRKLTPLGEIMIFLPHTSGSTNGMYYHYALIPVRD